MESRVYKFSSLLYQNFSFWFIHIRRKEDLTIPFEKSYKSRERKRQIIAHSISRISSSFSIWSVEEKEAWKGKGTRVRRKEGNKIDFVGRVEKREINKQVTHKRNSEWESKRDMSYLNTTFTRSRYSLTDFLVSRFPE